MKLCERCRVSGCSLDYLSEACAAARRRECPEIQLNRAECITNMNMYQLETELIPIVMNLCEDGVPGRDYIRHWLSSPKEDWEEYECR